MTWLDHVAVKRLPQDTRKNPGFRSGPWSRHPVVRSRSLWTPSFRWRGSGSSDPIRVTTKPHTLRIRTLRVQTLVIEGSIPSKEGPRILRVTCFPDRIRTRWPKQGFCFGCEQLLPVNSRVRPLLWRVQGSLGIHSTHLLGSPFSILFFS